ncbi:MAG: hypothetical protein NLN64_01360 [Candidatus Thalassarchaeaceae archaeon]|nr:hypothetical protein [Candidatus Thalassarchaeaceae archaeon]
MEIIWAKINPGEVYIGSNNRTILFGDIGPRHENKIVYNFEISSTPVKKEVAHKLLSSSEYQIASETEWELALKQKMLIGDYEIEELGDKVRNSYWEKYCDGRTFIDNNWIMKIGRKWNSGVPEIIYLDKDQEVNFVRIVRRGKHEFNDNNSRLPKSSNRRRLILEELIICFFIGIIPSFMWAYFNASKNYILEGWLNLVFGGLFIGFFTIIFWRPPTKIFQNIEK